MRRALVTTSIVLALAGCGSTPKGTLEYNTANELATSAKYSEAIAYLQQALALNPKNEEYQAKLATYKTQYLNSTLAELQNLLSSQPTKRSLDNADALLQELASSGIEDPQTAQMQASVDQARAELYAQLASDYEQAKMAMDASSWVEAYGLLTSISERFDNYEDVNKRIQTVTSSANKTYLKEANAAIKRDDFVSARNYLNNLLAIIPGNPIAKSLLARVEQNDNKDYFVRKAQAAYAQQDWNTVLVNCTRVRDFEANSQVCKNMLLTAKTKLAERDSELLLSAMNDGRLLEARDLFVGLVKLNTLTAQRIKSLRTALSQQSAYSAESYKQANQYAMAWTLYQSVRDVNPEFTDLFSRIREVEDAISDRSRRQIAVFDFNSPAQSDDAGVIIANNLISRLFNNASNDITILERENLKSILEEMKLGQMGVVSESTAKEMGRVYGIDFAIMGSVLLYKVDENTSASTKTIRYQIGERIEDNIDYLNWKAMNPDPDKKELRAAPKAKIMVPEYDEKEYEVTQTKKVGFLQLSFRIVDVLTGENTRVDTIERKIQIEDTANAGVKDAGILFDPMEVPTDTEILQQLTEEIVESMAGEVLRPLQQLETFYFNQGVDRQRRAEYESAVEFFTYAIFNEKLKSVSSSPVSEEARKRINAILEGYKFNVG
jgi:tetratricopeptide (TPR) repeat protein